MAVTDFPWFKIYAAETLSDENFASWGPAERGIWFTLVCHCWKEGSIPDDLDRLARLCGCDARAFPEHWSSIAQRFRASDTAGRLVCPRLEFERSNSLEEASKKSDHGRSGANARWSRYKSAMPEQCPSNAQVMPNDAPQPEPKNKETTTPTPSGPGVAVAVVVPPAPRPPRKLRAPLSAIPEVEDRHVLACEGILAVWPKTDGEDHRRVGCNEASLVMRLIHWEKTNPAYTMAVLVESAVTFCKAPHFRFPAPEVYFSKALPTDDRKAHFKETADAIVNRNRRRESTAMVPPAPINLRPSPGASA